MTHLRRVCLEMSCGSAMESIASFVLSKEGWPFGGELLTEELLFGASAARSCPAIRFVGDCMNADEKDAFEPSCEAVDEVDEFAKSVFVGVVAEKEDCVEDWPDEKNSLFAGSKLDG